MAKTTLGPQRAHLAPYLALELVTHRPSVTKGPHKEEEKLARTRAVINQLSDHSSSTELKGRGPGWGGGEGVDSAKAGQCKAFRGEYLFCRPPLQLYSHSASVGNLFPAHLQ